MTRYLARHKSIKAWKGMDITMENWNQIEVTALIWIQENLRTEILDSVMPFLSMLNNGGMLSILTVGLLLLWRKYRYVGVTACSSLVMEGLLLNVFLKNFVHRIRPYSVDTNLVLLGDVPVDFSFPSGHTGAAFAVAVVMLLCMPRRYGVTAMTVAALISLSRLYNGAHYPTDVLGAVFIAAFTGVVAWKLVFPRALERFGKVQDTKKE